MEKFIIDDLAIDNLSILQVLAEMEQKFSPPNKSDPYSFACDCTISRHYLVGCGQLKLLHQWKRLQKSINSRLGNMQKQNLVKTTGTHPHWPYTHCWVLTDKGRSALNSEGFNTSTATQAFVS